MDSTPPVARFSSSADPQSASRLLQLPVEVRLKILRYLHKDPDAFIPLETDLTQWYGFEPEVSRISLSAQALRTCQRLYSEIVRVLYEENVLVITVNVSTGTGRWDLTEVEILSVKTFAGAFYGFPEPEPAEGNHINSPSAYWSMGVNPNSSSEGMSRFSFLIMRMEKIHVQIIFESVIDLYLGCRTIENISKQKDLVLQLVSVADLAEEELEADVLRSCTGLRCCDIEVKGLSETTLRSQVATDVLTIIRGKTPRSDLFDSYSSFLKSALDDDTPIFADADDSYELNDLDLQKPGRDLDRAVAFGDAQKFMLARQAIITKFKEALRSWSDSVIVDRFTNDSVPVSSAQAFMRNYVDQVVDSHFPMKTSPDIADIPLRG